MVLKQLGDAEGVISRTASGLCFWIFLGTIPRSI